MPTQIAPVGPQPFRLGYWLLVGTLVVWLLLIGVYDETVLTFFTALWQKALAALGLSQQVEALQQGVDRAITKRLLPAVATYAALYLASCLFLLYLLLPSPAHWRLVLRLYASALAVFVALACLGKVVGDAPWAYRLSRQILDFVVSPLPVAGLYVLFRAGFGPDSTKNV